MSHYGQAQKKLDGGSRIRVYYYKADFDTFFVAFQPDPYSGSEPDWSKWSLELYDGDTKLAESPDPRLTFYLDQLETDAVSVVVNHDSGFSRLEPITETMEQAYQEVEGFNQSPFTPDFTAMSDPDFMDWVRREDTYLSVGRLYRVAEYVEEDYITDEQARLIVEAWMDENL